MLIQYTEALVDCLKKRERWERLKRGEFRDSEVSSTAFRDSAVAHEKLMEIAARIDAVLTKFEKQSRGD